MAVIGYGSTIAMDHSATIHRTVCIYSKVDGDRPCNWGSRDPNQVALLGPPTEFLWKFGMDLCPKTNRTLTYINHFLETARIDFGSLKDFDILVHSRENESL